jgi:hypothetical protein
VESRYFGFPGLPFLGISKAYLLWPLRETSFLTTRAFIGSNPL